MRKILALLLLVAISMTILGGCGGDDKYVKLAKAGPLLDYEYGGNIEKGLKDYITGEGAKNYSASWKSGKTDSGVTEVVATITYTYEGDKQELVLYFTVVEFNENTSFITSSGVKVDGDFYDKDDFWDEVFG